MASLDRVAISEQLLCHLCVSLRDKEKNAGARGHAGTVNPGRAMVSLELAGTKLRENACVPSLHTEWSRWPISPNGVSLASVQIMRKRPWVKPLAASGETGQETNHSGLCFNFSGCEAESKNGFSLPSICRNLHV